MKNTLLIFTYLFFSVTSLAQNSFVLEKKDSSKKEVLTENQVIKVQTSDSKWFTGPFTVLDDKSISIDNQVILIQDIKKIKIFSGATKIIKGAGTVAITSGVAVAAGGNFVLTGALVAGGLVLRGGGLLIEGGNHKPHKWNYTLIINPK